MKTDPAGIVPKPPGLSPSSVTYERGLRIEVGRVLGDLADALEKTWPVKTDDIDPTTGIPGIPFYELHVSVPWDFAAGPDYPAGRPAFGQSLKGQGDSIDLSGLEPATKGGEEARRAVNGLVSEGQGEFVARWATLATASHSTLELVGDRPEWRDLPVELDPTGRRFALRVDLREWLDANVPIHDGQRIENLNLPQLLRQAQEAERGGGWSGEFSLRSQAVGIITAGAVAGFGHIVPDDFPVGLGEPLVDLLDAELCEIPKPVFSFDGKSGVALVQFGPCAVDGEAGRAAFTIGASVLIFDRPEKAGADERGRAPLVSEIPAVAAGLRELAKTYRPEGATIFGPAPAPPSAAPKRPSKPSPLLDVRSRMDPETVKLGTFAVQGALPRTWRKARRWEEAEQDRIDAILREHGDEAFEKTSSRPALLTKRRGKTALADREKSLLEVELGTRGGFLRTDSDGEWLVRALRVGAGFVTIALSWYQSAEKLVSDRREVWADDLRSQLDKGGPQKRLSFDELSAETREKIEKLLEHIGSLEDARHLLDAVLRRAFATGAKIVDIPARELRVLLGCDGPDGRGNERIRRGFAALEHLSFKVVHRALKGAASGKFQGRFVASHGFFAGGSGAHSDGIFVVELASPVPGVVELLDASARGKTSITRGRATAAIESPARTPATEKSIELLGGVVEGPRLRQRRRKGDRPARALSTVGPWRKRALCRSVHEERAFDFIEGNLTTSLAPDVLGRPNRLRKIAATSDGLRVYDRSWCPLLGEGEWVGVLGTHRRSPETGWTLRGRETFTTSTGGRRPAGLIDQVGRPFPSGSAHAERKREALATLEDFAAVLGRVGGILVGVRGRGGQRSKPESWDWVSLEEGRELPAKELVAIRWYPFLPADWARRADGIVEERQAERVARGEGERHVFVTRSPSDYLAAAEADGIRWQHKPGEVEELEVWPSDGRERPAPDVRPLGDRLAEKIEAEGMKKGDVAKAFGVSPASLSRWLRPLAARDEQKGSGVPAALGWLVERWVEGGPLPTAEELEAVSARHGKARKETV
jgi:hypothetical protein